MQAMQQRAAPRIRVGDYFVSDLRGNLQGTLLVREYKHPPSAKCTAERRGLAHRRPPQYFGPVHAVDALTYIPNVGYVLAVQVPSLHERGALSWINVWCSHNINGEERASGVQYLRRESSEEIRRWEAAGWMHEYIRFVGSDLSVGCRSIAAMAAVGGGLGDGSPETKRTRCGVKVGDGTLDTIEPRSCVKVGDSTPDTMRARSGKKVDDSTPETWQGRSGRKVADRSAPDTMQVHFEFVMLSGACFEPLTMEVDGMTSCGSIFSHLNLDSELGWRIVLPGDRVCDVYSQVLTAVTRPALSSGVVWVQVLQVLPETRKSRMDACS